MTILGARKTRPLTARAEAALSVIGSRTTRRRKKTRPEETTLVCEAMSRHVAAIEAEAAVADAAERLAEQDVGVLAICRAGDRLSGVITDRDIVVRVIAQGLDPDELTVGECGSGEPATGARLAGCWIGPTARGGRGLPRRPAFGVPDTCLSGFSGFRRTVSLG